MKKIACVSFEGFGNSSSASSTKKYYFFTKIEDLKKGDVVLVQSFGNLSLANFLGYEEEGKVDHEPHKWIISRVDVSLDNELKETEEKKKQLEAKIQKRSSLYKGIEKNKLIALYDPQMKKLLTELDKLNDKEKTCVVGEIEAILVKNIF